MRRALPLLGLALAGLGACRSAPLAGVKGDVPWQVEFSGNESFDDKRLAAVIAQDIEGLARRSSHRAVVDDAAFSIEQFYRQEGFHFATLEYAIDPGFEGVRAHFLIQEGPRTEIEGVEFEGNRAFDDERLERFFRPRRDGLFGTGAAPFVQRQVESAARAVEAYYIANGYLDARVEDPQARFDAAQTRARVTIRLQEGKRYHLRAVRIEGGIRPIDRKLEVGELLEGLEVVESGDALVFSGPRGKPYSPALARTLRGQLEELYGRYGHPDAKVVLAGESRGEDGRVDLVYSVEPGPRVSISEVRIAGNEKTDPDRIRGALELEAGDTYDLQKVRQSFRNLYRMGLFSTVRIELADVDGGQESERPLLVEVEEAPSQELYVEPGYGSYEQFRLSLGWREKNLFGSGRALNTEVTAAVLAQRAVVGISDPRFLDTNTNANWSVFANRRVEPSFTSQELGSSVSFSRQFTERIQGLVNYAFRRSEISDADILDPTAQMALNNVDISSVTLAPSYDTRDNKFVPTKGVLTKLSVEYGDRNIGSQLEFVRLRWTQDGFLELSEDTVLGLSWRGGLIAPILGTATIPVQERFYNGGENTVRSFTEKDLGPKDSQGNPLGGEAFNVFSVELRQRILGPLEGAVFYDTGNVVPDYTDFSDFEDFRHAIGFGVRYLLPVGPIRLDVGFNPDRKPQEDDYAIHLSVGMSF
jgi:outer membrane protein insertion porin family